MAQKKYKKRHHNSTVTAKKQAEAARIADEKDRNRKRMDPTARTLLLGDLVFLALVSMLDMAGMLPAPVSAICSLIGIALMFLGVWFQFGRGKNRKSFGSNRNDWPGLR